MGEERKHHRISMSQWSTLAVCPHFMPSQKPSPEADSGVAAHRLAEETYRAVQGLPPEEAFKHEHQPTPQSAWCAYRWRRLQDMADIPEPERGQYAATCAVEMKLTIQQTDPLIDGIYGFADFVRLLRRQSDGQLIQIAVADFKTFSDGTKNFDEQLAGYAVAVASTIPNATDDIQVMLITNHGAVKRDTMMVTTLGWCRRIAVDVVTKYLCRDRFEKVLNPKCKYCANYPCKGALAIAAAVDPVFERLKLTAQDMNAHPETVPLILSSLEEVQKLVDETKANAMAAIKTHGVKEPGKDGLDKWSIGNDDCRYSVVQSLGSRKIPNSEAAMLELVLKQRILDTEQFVNACTVKVAALETALKKSTGKKPDEIRKMLADSGLVERGKTSESLKRVA